MRWRSPDRRRRGSNLLEFAMVALVLTFLLAATLDFGRAIHGAEVLQQAADVGARELARTPLPATMTFDEALQDPTVKAQVYDDSQLVVQLSAGETVFDHFANGPIVNRLLAPLMIVDANNVARYPGAVLDPGGSGFYVVPVMLSDGGMRKVRVFEEIPDTSAAGADPFQLNSPGQLKGFAAVRINYPFQAAGLVAYHQQPGPNGTIVNVPITAPDIAPGEQAGPYGGADQLGKLLAHGETVRPFRRLLSAQAIYRREVFSN